MCPYATCQTPPPDFSPYPIPPGRHRAPALGAIMHQTPTGYLFYMEQYICFTALLLSHPTLSSSN